MQSVTTLARVACALLALAAVATPAASASNPRSIAKGSRVEAQAHAIRLAVALARRELQDPGMDYLHQVIDPGGQLAAASDGLGARIIGGASANQGQASFMAEVIDQPPGTNDLYFCSGTVVSSNVILTAGHCTVDQDTWTTKDPGGFAVITGAADWTNTANRQVSSVYETIPYPYYDPSDQAADLGLLVLSQPIQSPTIAMPTNADQYLELGGTGALIAGWGETYSDSGPSTILQWAPTVVQRAGYCGLHSAGTGFYYSSAYGLCSVNPPSYSTGACDGDSGGPLFLNDATGTTIELGITSWVDANCDTTYPSYFTATLPFAAWVDGEINAVAPPSPSSTTSSGSSAPASPQSPPRLTVPVARSYVHETLAGVFRRILKHSSSYTTSCSRLSLIRISCNASFSSGPNDYYGYVTIHYLFGENGTLQWTDNYVMHWVNDQCYFHSGHRASCHVSTKRGAW